MNKPTDNFSQVPERPIGLSLLVTGINPCVSVSSAFHQLQLLLEVLLLL